jgi:hypothetical protein
VKTPAGERLAAVGGDNHRSRASTPDEHNPATGLDRTARVRISIRPDHDVNLSRAGLFRTHCRRRAGGSAGPSVIYRAPRLFNAATASRKSFTDGSPGTDCRPERRGGVSDGRKVSLFAGAANCATLTLVILLYFPVLSRAARRARSGTRPVGRTGSRRRARRRRSRPRHDDKSVAAQPDQFLGQRTDVSWGPLGLTAFATVFLEFPTAPLSNSLTHPWPDATAG